MTNPLLSGQNYCEVVYECSADLQCNDSHIVFSYIRNRWWDNVSIEMMSDASVLFEMIMVRNHMMT